MGPDPEKRRGLSTTPELAGSRLTREPEKQAHYQSNVYADGRKSRRIESIRHGWLRSVFVNTDPTKSRIARNLEKQTNYQSNVFAEVKKSRSDTDGLDPCLWTATPLAAGPMVRPTTLSGRRKAFCIYIRPCCGLKRNIFATSTISHYGEGLL